MFTSLALGISLCILPGISFAETYTVKPGDTLWKISRDYGTTVSNIQSLNNLNSALLHPGQQLVIGGQGQSPAQPQQQVSRGLGRVSTVLSFSKSLLGVPYVSGGSSPSGFDCSGYVKYVFGHFGINLPRTAGEQYNAGLKVSSAEARPGDLVAFKTGGYISHVGIYLGDSQFISATSSNGIDITSVHGPYWGSRFLGFSRIM
jgi:peptidoglycan endopeptidase LytE